MKLTSESGNFVVICAALMSVVFLMYSFINEFLPVFHAVCNFMIFYDWCEYVMSALPVMLQTNNHSCLLLIIRGQY